MQKDLIPTKKVTNIFPRFMCKVLPLAFDESMSYYECICALLKKVNECINTLNNNSDSVTELQNKYIELQNKYIELKNYVDNYFTNLDVQEEINNKLDQMVEDGTLNELIQNYFEKLEKVQFITNGFITNSYSQDIHIIKYNNKNILVDTGSDLYWNSIKDFIDKQNITHFDYAFITHYHGDHIGNLTNLIENNYITNTTELYMPIEVTKWADITEAIKNNKVLLSEHNIKYQVPTNDTKIKIENLDISFYNCNPTISDEIYNWYNEASVVILFKHRNIKALYTGDCDGEAFKYFGQNKILCEKINLFKMGHHGINQFSYPDFLLQISPDYAIQNVGILDFQKNNISISEQGSILKNLNTLIYPTCMNKEPIILESDGSSIKVINGLNYELANAKPTITLYVDNNTTNTGIQTGSNQYPFKELMQAIGYIKNFPNFQYNINVANGNYGYSHESETNKNIININLNKSTNILIKGTGDKTKTILNGVNINNSFIKLENFTIDLTNNNGIYATNSNVKLKDIILNAETKGTKSGIISRNSNIYIENTSLNNANEGIICSDSTITIQSVIFNSVMSYYINQTTSNVICLSPSQSIKFSENVPDTKDFNNIHVIPIPDFILFNKYFSENITSVNLSEWNTNISKWDFIEIQFTSNDNNRIVTGKLIYPSSLQTEPVFFHNNGTNCWIKTCKCNLTNNVITLSNQMQIAIQNGQTPTIETGDYIHITNVRLYKANWRYIN